ncbi:IS3 family transposase [Corynebacterium choanae]|uniref:IS3 family transposase n=1 Tax=Corynebacterium choanae TaxID=1862358 RepID=UPI00319E0E68
MLVERISTVHRDNYSVYGVRKMWHALRRDGIDIGREQTARLMRLAGVSGKGKGRSPITTRKPGVPDLRPDLVEREFKAPGPNKLWVADITTHTERLCVRGICHRRLLPTDSGVGAIGLDAH